jgi:hypothetical protein
MFNPMTIRILRRHHTEERPEFDDKITINKITENRLKVVYMEKSGMEPVVDIAYMGYHQFVTYMHRILFLLIIDEDPFLSIQFMIPGYPSTLISVTNLKSNFVPIMELLWSACFTWPTASTNQRNIAEE